jgi:hypothetical protein
MTTHAESDKRTPSPPFGYSRPCTLGHEEQVRVVAQFHAHRIRPNRIAYRMGIDIAVVEALIAGELEPERFPALVEQYRRQRHSERLRESKALPPGKRFEHQQAVEKDRQKELQGEALHGPR